MKYKQLLLLNVFLALVSCIEQTDSLPIPEIKPPISDTTTFNPYFQFNGIVAFDQNLDLYINGVNHKSLAERIRVDWYKDSIIYFRGLVDFREGRVVSDCMEDTLDYELLMDTSLVFFPDMEFWECTSLMNCDPFEEVLRFEIVVR